jgi:SAM-dependent methyltransferase
MRPDISIIADLVTADARVLDLGCGDGELLAYLRRTKGVNGYGLEINHEMITSCIKAGVERRRTDRPRSDKLPERQFRLRRDDRHAQSVGAGLMLERDVADRPRMHRDVSELRTLALPAVSRVARRMPVANICRIAGTTRRTSTCARSPISRRCAHRSAYGSSSGSW